MTRTPTPRSSHFFGMATHAHHYGETWLEPEEITYPNGGMTRRARVRVVANAHYPTPDVPVGSLRVVLCSIADTVWSIPACLSYRGRTITGFVAADPDTVEYTFTPYPEEV